MLPYPKYHFLTSNQEISLKYFYARKNYKEYDDIDSTDFRLFSPLNIYIALNAPTS